MRQDSLSQEGVGSLEPDGQPEFGGGERDETSRCRLAGTCRVEGPQFPRYLEGIMKMPLAGLDQLSTNERLQLVQDLWDSIAAEPESVPVTDAQREELERRLSAYREANDAAASWTEAKERLRDER